MKLHFSLLGGALAFLLATSCCWLPWLALLLAGSALSAGVVARLEIFSGPLMGLGAVSLGYAGYTFWQKRRKMEAPVPVLQSRLTCPHCGFAKTETMPTDACQFFYDCTHCGALLKPRPGDCCVFCSYGTVVCPPRQTGDKNCC